MQTSCSLSGVMVTGTSKGEPRHSPASSRNWIRSRCTSSSSGDMFCGTAGSAPGTAARSGQSPRTGSDTRVGRGRATGGTPRGARGREGGRDKPRTDQDPHGGSPGESPERRSTATPAACRRCPSRSRYPDPAPGPAHRRHVRAPHVRRKRERPSAPLLPPSGRR